VQHYSLMFKYVIAISRNLLPSTISRLAKNPVVFSIDFPIEFSVVDDMFTLMPKTPKEEVLAINYMSIVFSTLLSYSFMKSRSINSSHHLFPHIPWLIALADSFTHVISQFTHIVFRPCISTMTFIFL
jgi:hypothetical protein